MKSFYKAQSITKENKVKKKTIVLSVVASSLLLGGIALATPYAFSNHHGGDHHAGEHVQPTVEQQQQKVALHRDKLATFLDLDAYQQQQAEELLGQYWQENQALTDNHETRHDIMHNPQSSDDVIRKKMVAEAELEAEQTILERKLRENLGKILTDEQKEKAELLWSVNNHHGRSMHNGGYHH
jgi:Spy/CpxP family protein refolding chaperone